MKRIVLLPVLFCIMCLSLDAQTALSVASIFGDHMVLQRDQKVPVWGWGEPGMAVTVSARGVDVTANADASGTWSALIGPFAVGDAFDVEVSGDEQHFLFRDVVAGEVWLCSGQSNMEWTMNRALNASEERTNANHSLIRHVKINKSTSLSPLADAGNSGWQVCSPETVGPFTAVGYFFGRHLHQELNVPIGLINSSWGGTIVEKWASVGAMKTHPDFTNRIAQIEAQVTNTAGARAVYDTQIAAWQSAFDEATNSENEQWQAQDLDDSAWKPLQAPGVWEHQGLANVDGVIWLRKTVTLPEGWAGKALTLSMCAIDDDDTTWVNGVQVGTTLGYAAPRRYTVPASAVSTGLLTVAVRVFDSGGMGGIHGNAADLKLECPGEQPLSLAGAWSYHMSAAMAQIPTKPTPPLSMQGANHPTLLFNAMINPIVPYGMRGVIWYQGESNAGRAYQYRSLFPLLIKDWRVQWKSAFPFYFVQLANYMQAPAEPQSAAWPELREAQSMTLALPKTGQAVIIDIGEARNIHPKNKQDVGLRLALIALAQDYGQEDVVFSGPTYREMKIVDNTVRLSFDHGGGGLVSHDGNPLKHFAIAGADQHFVWADAVIEGDVVLVSSAEVAAPVAIRYAWANNPDGCNLYNAEGLPASPFRTDDWPGVTVNNR